MPKTPLTMADLAREAGVSKITVSRALSNHPLVKPATRERIRALAEERGYKFNVAARNLRLQRTQTIAVVIEMIPTASRPIGEPYPLALLGGIIQELATAGYSAVLSTADNFVRVPPSVDGVILLGQGVHDDAVTNIERCKLPLIIWGSVRNDSRHVIVGSDNVTGGALVAQRLATLGRRRAVFLGDVGYTEMADRFDGFTERLASNGGQLLAAEACPFTFEDGYQHMAHLIDRFGDTIDGVFGCNDAIAMGAIRALTEAKRHVPDDVTVIGFDDSASAALFLPALTTIRQDWHEGGRLLARKALAMAQGENPLPEQMPVSLIVRSS
ncbi:MAG: LacI family DNA-binding transcriptional regulator [Pseudomonadota bacterium]